MLAHRRRAPGRRKRSGSRWRDFYTPSITEGLLLNVPFRHDGRPLYSVGGATGLSLETVDADGSRERWQDDIIESAIANTARIERLGIRLEGARTNGQVRSSEFDNASWAKSQCTVTPDGIVAPNHLTEADMLIEDATPAAFHFLNDTAPHTNGNKHVLSIYAKGCNGRDWLYLYGDNSGAEAIAYFNVTTGVLGTVAGTSAPAGRIDPVPYANGWYKCQLTWTTASATGNRNIGIGLADADGSGQYNGDGASYICIWGCQSEDGAIAASSLIPTAAAGVERANDNIQITNGSAVHCKAAAGTIIGAVTPHFDGADLVADAHIIDVADANDGVRLFFDQSNAGKLTGQVLSGGGTVATLVAAAAPTYGTTYVVGVVWALNDFALYMNAVEDDTDAAGAAPTAISAPIMVGQDLANTKHGFLNLAHLLIYDSRLPAASIQRVTRKDYTRWIPTLSL